MDPLAASAVGASSNITNSKRQMTILDQSKTVAESVLQMTMACKEGGGNPKATQHHKGIWYLFFILLVHNKIRLENKVILDVK